MRVMTAVESRAEVRKAARAWARKFSEDAAEVGSWDAPVWWHESERVWGAFAVRAYADGLVRYRNRFGIVPNRFAETTLVQINPPSEGENTNRQGLFARENGRTWVLHLGRIHPGAAYVGEDEFAKFAPPHGQVEVGFKSGKTVLAHAVADLDASPDVLRGQMAAFVRVCETIRLDVLGQRKVAENVNAIADIEDFLFPEATEDYLVSPQAAAIRARNHGRVWAALAKHLREMGLGVSNGRVGRHGPDLYILGGAPVLFEIKSSCSAASIQQGLGQLLLYEKLLKRSHVKVLVLPTGVDGALESALGAFKVRVLRYQREGATVTFPSEAVSTAITI